MAPSTPTDVRATRVVAAGGSQLELATGVWAPCVLARMGPVVRVGLVGTTATLLGGDRARLEVVVGEGVRVELVDVAATVAYHGRGRSAEVEASVVVAPGGCLVWAGEPLVVCEGADVTRRLSVDVGDGGRALLRDTVVLGRPGEQPGSLRCLTSMTYAAEPALVEELDLRGADGSRLPGLLGGARVVDTVTALGWRPRVPASVSAFVSPSVAASADAFELEQPGAVLRHLGREAHDSPAPGILDRWRGELEAMPPREP